MRRIALVAALLVMAACGGKKNEVKQTVNPLADLIATSELYKSRAVEVQGDSGFIEHDKCDSLLFTALAWGSGFEGIDIYAARDTKGLWHRTPSQDCYETGRSGSQTSKDMLVGLQFGAFLRGADDILKQVYEYGKKHKWVYGKGPLDRTFFLPQFVNTLRMLIGKDDDFVVDIWVDPLKDHQRHVVALNIILRGESEGNIRDDQLDLLSSFRKKEPNNALFQYGYHRFSDGDHSETLALLRNTKYFPLDRLPNNTDRCHRWLWEKSENSGEWQPCEGERIHSGGDFSFIVALLERSGH